MDKRKRDDFAPPALGGSSLLVVFAVLALTVFALLSLSTVRADVRLGDAAAKAVTDYYAADTRAQEILAQLRNGVSNIPISPPAPFRTPWSSRWRCWWTGRTAATAFSGGRRCRWASGTRTRLWTCGTAKSCLSGKKTI